MKKFFLIVVFLSLSCKRNTIEDDITSLIENVNKKNIIFIISDNDCSSCYNMIINAKDNNTIYSGYFNSKYPKAYKSRLVKLNPIINWKSLDNKSLLYKFREKYNKNGPFKIHFEEGVIKSIN